MLQQFRRRAVFLLILLALMTTPIVPLVPPVAAQQTVPVAVTISRFEEIDNPDPGLFQGFGDYYSRVTIDGFPRQNSATISGNPGFGEGIIGPIIISPFWVFSRDVDAADGTATVTIEIVDEDGFGSEPDDVIDLNPNDGVTALTLTVDLATGDWTGDWTTTTNSTSSQGDGDRAHFADDEGGERGRVFFDVSILSASGDADGDGLLDGWERKGFDADGDGISDVDLPGFGAHPLQSDLFLELDHSPGQTPTRADIRALKRAFAAAPNINPDGTSGIKLFVDTGDLADPNAIEGQPEGSCMDGIDNGGDGLIDGADQDCRFIETSTENRAGNCADGVDNDLDGNVDAVDLDCLVGDNLGGGNSMPSLFNCGMDAAFYAAKSANFNPNRGPIFRYAISTEQDIDTDGKTGPDTASCNTGGQGEIGGNDFIEYNHDGGTIMHELGHNLNLRHGGNENNHCKPNYVSTMNYDVQFGVPRAGGGVILDYSPPRVNVNGLLRGAAPLDPLVEHELDETVVLDSSDNSNRFVFVNALGIKVQNNLNVQPDWNGDADALDTDVQANIDTAGPNGRPAGCAGNTSNNDTLEGFNDWNQVSIPFRQFGNSADSAINPETDPIPTREDLDQMIAALNTTDLSISVIESEDPVAAGTSLTYTLTIVNHGPNPATSVQVTNTLPADVTFAGSSEPCLVAAKVVNCNLGEMAANTSRMMTIVANVPSDLVYSHGGPTTISNTTSVENLAGPDPNMANNSDSDDTSVIAVADTKISGITATSPLEVLIGQPASATIAVTVANDGPSSPVDTILTGTTSAGAGISVTPSGASEGQTALLVGTPRTVSQTVTLECATPGVKTVAFDYGIAPANAAVDIDPDPSNNIASASFQIECVVPVVINIKPKGLPNSVNLRSLVPVALLTTEADEYGLPLAFDATTIQPQTMRFGAKSDVFNVSSTTGATESHNQGHIEHSYELDEQTRDSDFDMLAHFTAADSELPVGAIEACVKGKFTAPDGNTYTFLGCDSIVIRP